MPQGQTRFLHTSLMSRAILANCKSEWFIQPDGDSPQGAKMVTKDEFAKTLVGVASYIAENYPQLFEAIPLYLTHISQPLSKDSVKDFMGQSLQVSTTEVSDAENGVYARQTIVISKEVRLELEYSFSNAVIGTIYYNNRKNEAYEIRTMSELCDVVQRFSGEVVMVEQVDNK